MIQREKKNLSEMKERLHKMRMEIQELEETIEMCNTEHNYYDNNYDNYEEYNSRNRDYRANGDREYRNRSRY